MMDFKFFHGYTNIDEPDVETAFDRLMNMFHELDRMAADSRNNYELPDDDISDWDVTLSDGLSEE